MTPPSLNIYGQRTAQDPVRIVGTREGQQALIHAATSALLYTTNQYTPTLYAGNVEPYELAVTLVEEPQRMAVYRAPWHFPPRAAAVAIACVGRQLAFFCHAEVLKSLIAHELRRSTMPLLSTTKMGEKGVGGAHENDGLHES